MNGTEYSVRPEIDLSAVKSVLQVMVQTLRVIKATWIDFPPTSTA